jgi:Type II secretion system (T2SS), protein E, N-terminal domain
MAVVKKLGDLLKEAGLIDDFQLESALSHQRNWGGKLGNILVDLEFVREVDIARLVADKLRIPHVDLFEPEIHESVVKLIKPEIAKKYNVVPAKKDKGTLVLAMSDPLDIEALDEIRFITGLTIKPALAMNTEIKDAIKKYYEGEEVSRAQPLFHQHGRISDGKMEIIRGHDLNMPRTEASDPNSTFQSKEESLNQALQDSKTRIDALTTLLIEKGLISREELVGMIYQKKMGL